MSDSPTAAAPDLEALEAAWGGPPSEHDKLHFLTLAADRRREALARIRTLQNLTNRAAPPTRNEQQRSAEELGLSLNRLQELMRDWSHGPTILKAAPHAVAARPRTRTFPAREILEKIIKKALARDPWVAEPSVSARVTAICQRLNIQPPARMTVRRALEKIRASTPHPGRYIDEPTMSEPSPSGPGAKLLLTKEYFRAAIVETDGSVMPASARFLIDMTSWFIVGVTSSDDLADLLRESVESLTDAGYSIGQWRRPEVLLIATDLSQQEEEVIRGGAERSGVKVEYALRRRIRRWTASILRLGFDQLRLAPPPTRRSGPGLDWPRLTRDEFDYFLQKGVDAYRWNKVEMIDRLDPADGYGSAGGHEELAEALTELFGNK